ncbi:MAG TPA: polysaccharide deacetylase family protein [Rhodanobacteraceae bacterium]
MKMVFVRAALARPLHLASFWLGHALHRAKAIRCARILMYHHISPDGVSVEQFQAHLELLRNNFEIIAFGKLLDRLATGSLSGDEIVITFDDGVRNNFHVAWPLLREQNVPATFFVCPGLIDSGEWIWRLELRARLALLGTAERKRLAATVKCPGAKIEELMAWTKKLPYALRREFQDSVSARTRQFEPTTAQIDEFAPMTWPQLLELDPRLITIGSHTSTHPILVGLSDELAHAEIAGSRTTLEQRLGRPIELFCFPNGSHDGSAMELVSRNYRAAVTTRQAVIGGNDDLHSLPRVPAGDSLPLFLRRLHRPTA